MFFIRVGFDFDANIVRQFRVRGSARDERHFARAEQTQETRRRFARARITQIQTHIARGDIVLIRPHWHKTDALYKILDAQRAQQRRHVIIGRFTADEQQTRVVMPREKFRNASSATAMRLCGCTSPNAAMRKSSSRNPKRARAAVGAISGTGGMPIGTCATGTCGATRRTKCAAYALCAITPRACRITSSLNGKSKRLSAAGFCCACAAMVSPYAARSASKYADALPRSIVCHARK